jgi:hypothetical protein
MVNENMQGQVFSLFTFPKKHCLEQVFELVQISAVDLDRDQVDP